ncbi:hypothetical protein HF313_19470 [Massilia atriviolacea]|uniref:Uncharacterized protein n=1 Tax=Massilia atriviolacea TaxID=2495579 RepID=A0A430HSJ0_9BURK|nr:hypothetical protein [Massilia atriviolacea]RSZ60515.1 hypothetical protein EJB06_05230 [Massilia atriviolacea]
MVTPTNTSALAAKLGTGTLQQTIGSLGAYQQIMQAFVNYITSVGVPPQLPANDQVSASVTNAANTAITQLGNDFKGAQATASGLVTQINAITDVITAAATYTRHSEITIGQITQAIVAYSGGAPLDRVDLAAQLQRMAQNATRLESSVQTAQTNNDSAVKALQAWEAKLNSDFQALQTAIPPADGKVLNLSTLTEAQAAQQLTDQVNSLNDDIASLQKDINWLTFGEVSVGVVGGLIAITNFWNPIGWVAAGLTAFGEIEMVGKKAADVVQKNTDMQNLALTEDEQAILHPLYAIKNAVSSLSTGVNAAEAISTELVSMADDFSAAAQDIDSFISDVTSGATADDLSSDAAYVKSDYDTLQALCNTLLTPVPTQVVSQSQMSKVVDVQSAS